MTLGGVAKWSLESRADHPNSVLRRKLIGSIHAVVQNAKHPDCLIDHLTLVDVESDTSCLQYYGRAVEFKEGGGMRFEWDDAKEAINELKHGISFVDAATVFDDPYYLVENSTKPEYGEQRWKAIGIIGEYLVAVIYTDRQQRRRIISARRARKNEREQYDQSKTTRRWHLHSGAR